MEKSALQPERRPGGFPERFGGEIKA